MIIVPAPTAAYFCHNGGYASRRKVKHTPLPQPQFAGNKRTLFWKAMPVVGSLAFLTGSIVSSLKDPANIPPENLLWGAGSFILLVQSVREFLMKPPAPPKAPPTGDDLKLTTLEPPKPPEEKLRRPRKH